MEHILTVPASADAQTVYCPVLADKTLLGGYVVLTALQCDVISTVAFKSGNTTLGTATFPGNSPIGTIKPIVMSTTLATRKTKVTTAVPLTVVTGGEQTTATGFQCIVDLDDFALSRD